MSAQIALAGTVLLPLIGALLVAGLRRRTAAAPLGTLTAALGAAAAISLLPLAPPWRQATDAVGIDLPWIGLLGSRLHLGWDGITAPLVLLTALLGTLACGYVWLSRDNGAAEGAGAPPGLVICLLLTQASAVLTFTARDLLVFFIGFEGVLIPMWVVVARWGTAVQLRDRTMSASAAALRFVIYTTVGSAVMLLGFVLLGVRTGSTDLTLIRPAVAELDPGSQALIAALLIVGLGIKVPIWPVHSWLPAAHTAAPTVGSVLLAAVLLKLGSYGLVRLGTGLVPDGLAFLALPLAVLGVIGILWGGLVCLVENDLKRLIAYSSVAHMGFVVVGVASGTPEGVQGALFVGVAHGVITGLLFWVVGMIKQRRHTADLSVLPAGMRDTQPRLGWLLALAAIAGAGLPGLAGFWGEILAIIGAWKGGDQLGGGAVWIASLSAVGTALAAAYLFRVLYLIWHGAPEPDTDGASAQSGAEAGAETMQPETRQPETGQTETGGATAEPGRVAVTVEEDLTGVEIAVAAPLVVAAVALGVMPWLLLSMSGPVVRAMLGVG